MVQTLCCLQPPSQGRGCFQQADIDEVIATSPDDLIWVEIDAVAP